MRKVVRRRYFSVYILKHPNIENIELNIGNSKDRMHRTNIKQRGKSRVIINGGTPYDQQAVPVASVKTNPDKTYI